jgi:hypothetical protein
MNLYSRFVHGNGLTVSGVGNADLGVSVAA